MVAPHAGAWIETSVRSFNLLYRRSRPTRARGLKLNKGWKHTMKDGVAPHAGAWIETLGAPGIPWR